MIASPGDVAEERNIARQTIHDWNDVNSKRSGVVLTAVGWDSHASPELGARPQHLINTRVLEDCDLLIGIFWTRLGTPTGKAASGTLEEIEEHVAAGKPALIYFSDKPVVPQSVDVEQLELVKKVRAALREKGLVDSYDNYEEFRHKLGKHLQICLHKNEYVQQLLALAPEEVEEEKAVTQSPKLTAEARDLLKAASQDEHGSILRVEYIGGQQIQAGGRTFGAESRREFAKWEGALSELTEAGYVAAKGYRGEIYELTHTGWELADRL
jgi:hypothetical protein